MTPLSLVRIAHRYAMQIRLNGIIDIALIDMMEFKIVLINFKPHALGLNTKTVIGIDNERDLVKNTT